MRSELWQRPGAVVSPPMSSLAPARSRGAWAWALLGVLGLGVSAQAKPRATIHKTLEVPALGVTEIVVEHPLGPLTVRGWSRQTVLMKAVKRAPDEETAQRLRVHGEIRDGRLHIETRALMKGALPLGRKLHDRVLALRQELARLLGAPKPWSPEVRAQIQSVNETLLKTLRAAFELSAGTSVELGRAVPLKDAELELTVYLPRGASLTAQTLRGDIDAADLDGAVMLRTRHGRIFARNLAGGLRTRSDQGPQFLSTLKGTVDVDGLDGDLLLRSVHGDLLKARLIRGSIVAKGVDATQVFFSTTQGGVTLDAVLRTGGLVEVRTLRGDIDVRLNAPAGYLFRARADRGRLRTALGGAAGSGPGSERRGRVGRGRGRVVLSSQSGDLQLR